MPMLATPFAMESWVVLDSLNGSSILKEVTFMVSKTLRNIILAGIAANDDGMPNPLY